MPVSVDNVIRAETDKSFSTLAMDSFGKITHSRELAPIGRQSVGRPNRDTLYSLGVFDLDASPVTITLPDPGKRYMSLQVIDEDEYTPLVVYGAGSHIITRKQWFRIPGPDKEQALPNRPWPAPPPCLEVSR